MKIKNQLLLLVTLIVFTFSCTTPTEEGFETKTAEEGGYTYEYVTNDPMKARIYTLDNGLKVYLSVYKNEPRAHSFIAVKAGGKNDPADNTGLAHYLEHMMFKGTDKFGTLDWEHEGPLLDSIENMFNQYATLTSADERKDFYAKIDMVSNEAAKYAIANEYDKMISSLGGKGLNAYTTEDRTVYTSDIPANQLDKFMEIEGDRFSKIVNRLFHTELEAVYEEKNRSLDNDFWKAYEALYSSLFAKHQYGTQTVIGTIEHLKNPSITEIEKYFYYNYAPNNVAICISGDLDPTETIKSIEKHFGNWQPVERKEWVRIDEDPITAPVVKEVFGPDAERLTMGFRFNGRNSDDYLKMEIVDMLLNNSEAGLIDLNLVQKQKVLSAGCGPDGMTDYSVHTFYGTPREGQTLEEVKDLILEQIDKVKKGEFDDWLIEAVITDLKKSKMQQMERNYSRANDFVLAFTNGMSWADYISEMDKLEKITKEEIMAFATDHYIDNYAVVYKRNGEDPNKQQVEKPQITKVPLNREAKSAFNEAIASREVAPLSPVFIDYDKDIAKEKAKSEIEIFANQNNENELFSLYYLTDIGSNNDPKLSVAVNYLEYLGTEQLTPEEFRKELYKIGCSFNVFSSGDQTYVMLNGLDENMEKAMELFESLLQSPRPDQDALDDMIDGILKERADAKLSKGRILFSGLMNYGKYGATSTFTNVLSNYELTQLQADELTNIIKEIPVKEHRILYYGPRTPAELVTAVNTYHQVPEQLDQLPEKVEFAEVDYEEPQVYWTDYDMVQAEIIFLSKGPQYDKEVIPASRVFNEYYGALTFQEIREAQGLAYSVFSSYQNAGKADKADYIMAYIGTQADKQAEAMKAMMNLLNNMPESPEDFETAREAVINKIESERITKANILFNYEDAKDLNLDYDIRKDVYEKVKTMTFEDLKKFHETYIKGKKYVTVVIGSRDKLNFEDLKKYGQVKELSLEEIFGYGDVEKINTEIMPGTD